MSYIVSIYRIPISEQELLIKKTSNFNKQGNYVDINYDDYDKLPTKFKSLEKWPEFCNLKCFNCGCVTKRRPLFLPVMKNIEGSFIRGSNPIVCSKNCGLFQINLRYDDLYIRRQITELFNDLVISITGLDIDVLPADDPICLTKYGGMVTDNSYQNTLYNLNKKLIQAQYATSNLLENEEFIN